MNWEDKMMARYPTREGTHETNGELFGPTVTYGLGEAHSYPPHMEKDPTGVDQHTPGAKLDAGKEWLYTILSQFPNALRAVARVGEYGANKYSLGGWKHVDNAYERYSNALVRHMFPTDGEIGDDGFDHDWQVAWNALARLEKKLEKKQSYKIKPGQ